MSVLSDHIAEIAKAHFPNEEAVNPRAVDQYTSNLTRATTPGTPDLHPIDQAERAAFIAWLRHLANGDANQQAIWNMAAFERLRQLKYQALLAALMNEDNDEAAICQALQAAGATVEFAEHHGIHRLRSALENPQALRGLPWQLGFASLERKGQTKDGQHWIYTAKPWIAVYVNANHQQVAQLFAEGSFDRTRSESLCGLVHTAVQLNYQGQWSDGGGLVVNMHIENTQRTTFSADEKQALIQAATLAHSHGMQIEMEPNTASARAMQAWQDEMATRELEDGELHLFRPKDMVGPPKPLGIFQALRAETHPLLKSLAARIAHTLSQANSNAKRQLLETLSQQARERIDQQPFKSILNGSARLFLLHLVMRFEGNAGNLERLLAACNILDARYTDEINQVMLTSRQFRAYIDQWHNLQRLRQNRLALQTETPSPEPLERLCRSLQAISIPNRHINTLKDAHEAAVASINHGDDRFRDAIEVLGRQVSVIENLIYSETQAPAHPSPPARIEELDSDGEEDGQADAVTAEATPVEMSHPPKRTWRDRLPIFNKKATAAPSSDYVSLEDESLLHRDLRSPAPTPPPAAPEADTVIEAMEIDNQGANADTAAAMPESEHTSHAPKKTWRRWSLFNKKATGTPSSAYVSFAQMDQ